MELKIKILEYLAKRPYCRQRYIASACSMWVCDYQFLNSLHSLLDEGFINREFYHDPAQRDFYYLWYLTDKGKSVIINTENEERK